MANRFPLIVDSDNSNIKELPSGDVLDLTGNSVDLGTNTITDTKVGQWDTAYSWGDHGVEGYATEAYVDSEITALIGGAPGALDTLNELASALNDDSDFAGTVTASLSTKLENVVEDTTPQLGGDLASNGNDILFADNDKAIFGAGSDLQIYHTGSHSIIADNGTGNLQIYAADFQLLNGAETYMTALANGAVSLYYDNAAKLATTSDGVDITGEIYANRGRGATETASKTGSVTPDMDTYQNFVWTLTGNITLGNPGDEAVGQSGFFIFIHSGAARTVSLSSDWETAGAAGLTLSSASGAVDIVPYVVQSAGNILLGAPQLAFS